jgi:hypothetical protein
MTSMALLSRFCDFWAPLMSPCVTDSRMDWTSLGKKFKLTPMMQEKPLAAAPRTACNRTNRTCESAPYRTTSSVPMNTVNLSRLTAMAAVLCWMSLVV